MSVFYALSSYLLSRTSRDIFKVWLEPHVSEVKVMAFLIHDEGLHVLSHASVKQQRAARCIRTTVDELWIGLLSI